MSMLKQAQKSLVEWGKQKWGTKSGQPSSKQGKDIYLRKLEKP
jgi:hypothetical protein